MGKGQRPTLDAEPLASFETVGERAWVPLIHCQASNPTAPPLAPGSFSSLGHWTSQAEDSQPRALGNHRLPAGFKRYLKKLQIIPVIYLLGSIYWPGERLLRTLFKISDSRGFWSQLYICTGLLHKHMRTHVRRLSLSLSPTNTNPSMNTVFVFLCHLIVKLLAAWTLAEMINLMSKKLQFESQFARIWAVWPWA